MTEEGDDEVEAILKAAESLTVKGFHWAFGFMGAVTEICRNSNLFRKALLHKASWPSDDSSDDLALASSSSMLYVQSFCI